ncbi:hypothetical protein J3459_010863 [Metarhizium acridum]|nr:hypothetical protein J3459_010863 [Metarhizium acridum]
MNDLIIRVHAQEMTRNARNASPEDAQSLLPRCGVPKKKTPVADVNIFLTFASGSVSERRNTSFTKIAPSECAIKTKSRSAAFLLFASKSYNRSLAWEKMLP